MGATITITGDSDDALAAFDKVIAKFDDVESEAHAASGAMGDLNAEMRSGAASDFSGDLRRTSEELAELRERADRAADQAERLARVQEGWGKLAAAGATVAGGAVAIRQGFEFAVQAGEKVYELISRLAEQGDEDMLKLKLQIDSVGGSLERLGGTVIVRTLNTLSGDVETAAEGFGVLASAIDATSEKLKVAEFNFQALTSRAVALKEIAQFVSSIPDFADDAEAAKRGREELDRRTRAEQALGDIQKTLGEQENARRRGEMTDVREINALIGHRMNLLEEMKAGKIDGDEIAIRNEIIALEQQRLKVIEERGKAEQSAADAAAKAADELRQQLEAERQAAIDHAEAQAKRQADLHELMLDGLEKLQDEERDREQALEEQLLKREGREEEIHAKRMEWIREETREAVAGAETEEEKIAASLDGERRARVELHNEKLRLIDEEERARRAAEQAAKEAEADALERLQNAAEQSQRAAVEQVYSARVQEKQRDFLEAGGARGLNEKQRERELELIRRQEHRRTVFDAQNGRISPAELAASQQQIAESTARNAAASTRQNAGLAGIAENLARAQEEQNQFDAQLERRIRSIENQTRAQAERSRASRGGLNG